MDECLKQFGYEYSAPALFAVRNGNRADEWKKELKAKLNSSVQAVVLILPG